MRVPMRPSLITRRSTIFSKVRNAELRWTSMIGIPLPSFWLWARLSRLRSHLLTDLSPAKALARAQIRSQPAVFGPTRALRPQLGYAGLRVGNGGAERLLDVGAASLIVDAEGVAAPLPSACAMTGRGGAKPPVTSATCPSQNFLHVHTFHHGFQAPCVQAVNRCSWHSR